MWGGSGTNKETVRAGAHVLKMAANPLNRDILRTVLERPVEAAPGKQYEVTAGGREALFVAFAVERWLRSAPEGSIDFADAEAELAVDALAAGWSSGAIHMLAPGPRTFDELRRAVDGVNRRALRRTLSAMRRIGQVEVRATGEAGAAAYALTDWLRAGVAPLIAAARIERREPTPGTAPIDALDVEAAFLLALPLLELPRDVAGECRLGVVLEEAAGASLEGPAPGMAGVTARVERGRVASCTPGVDREADAWAVGTASDWLDTVIEPDAKRVRKGGDRPLAAHLLNSLHQTLFGVPTRG